MRLLVAGADQVDAGKTTFSVGLLARIGGTGFKPRAGNDYWFDHDDYRAAVGDGRLYGKDANRLAAASDGDPEPEEINPIHRLWQPAPGNPGMLGRDDRQFVVDRVAGSYVVNAAATVPDLAGERLPLSDAVRVDSLSAFNEVMATRHAAAQRAVEERIREADPAVVESYADVARPVASATPDAVAVVEPTRARIYDGDRYWKACEVASGRPEEGRLEERTGSVVELADPRSRVSLPALSAAERSDPEAIAAAYETAFDALLSVARD